MKSNFNLFETEGFVFVESRAPLFFVQVFLLPLGNLETNILVLVLVILLSQSTVF